MLSQIDKGCNFFNSTVETNVTVTYIKYCCLSNVHTWDAVYLFTWDYGFQTELFLCDFILI